MHIRLVGLMLITERSQLIVKFIVVEIVGDFISTRILNKFRIYK